MEPSDRMNELEENVSLIVEFKYDPEQFKEVMSKWVKNKWPVQYLVRDHLGAKIVEV